jgi:hypothetical protein
MMLLDNFGNQNAVGSDVTDSGLFVVSHKPAVTDNIGTEDSCEFAFKTFFCHDGTPHFLKVSNYSGCHKYVTFARFPNQRKGSL